MHWTWPDLTLGKPFRSKWVIVAASGKTRQGRPHGEETLHPPLLSRALRLCIGPTSYIVIVEDVAGFRYYIF